MGLHTRQRALGPALDGPAQWASAVQSVRAGVAAGPGPGSRRDRAWACGPFLTDTTLCGLSSCLLLPRLPSSAQTAGYVWFLSSCPTAPGPHTTFLSPVSTCILSRAGLFPGLQSCPPTSHWTGPSRRPSCSLRTPFPTTCPETPGSPVAPAHPWVGITRPSNLHV